MNDKYEVWVQGAWMAVTEDAYEKLTNNNHYGRINDVLQHGDPLKVVVKEVVEEREQTFMESVAIDFAEWSSKNGWWFSDMNQWCKAENDNIVTVKSSIDLLKDFLKHKEQMK